MQNRYLTQDEVHQLVMDNMYEINGNRFEARCFSGEYEKNQILPPLSIPGGNIGNIAILLAVSNVYGYEINISKAVEALFQLSGQNEQSEEMFASHAVEVCRHLYYLYVDSLSYNLKGADIEMIFTLFNIDKASLTNQGLRVKTNERALILFEATKGLYPHYVFNSRNGTLDSRVFVYHKKLIDDRHRALSSVLLSNGGIKLFSGLDAEDLYESLSEMSEIHLFETLQRIDTNLPFYHVSENGNNLTVEHY